MEFGKAIPYEIHIIPSSNKGYYVKVGCRRFTYSAGQEDNMMDDLEAYIRNPVEVEQKLNRECYNDVPQLIAAGDRLPETGGGN